MKYEIKIKRQMKDTILTVCRQIRGKTVYRNSKSAEGHVAGWILQL